MSGVAAIIPARIGSTRLPNKPLLRATGKYLIQHVHERVSAAQRIDRVCVATDSPDIMRAVQSFGGEAFLTSPDHQSGTDRVAEVARKIDAGFVLNVQGDEPDIAPDDLDRLAGELEAHPGTIVTLAVPIRDRETYEDPHAVKVVVDANGGALYFSRASIPYAPAFERLTHVVARKHLGVYGFSRETLSRFTGLASAPLETAERLEQLRALHHGIPIRVLDTECDSIGIDTEQDYERFVAEYRRQVGTSK